MDIACAIIGLPFWLMGGMLSLFYHAAKEGWDDMYKSIYQ